MIVMVMVVMVMVVVIMMHIVVKIVVDVGEAFASAPAAKMATVDRAS